MIAYFKKRKARKLARQWLHQARHARDLREDIADSAALQKLDETIAGLQAVLRKDFPPDKIHDACLPVAEAIRRICPPRSFGWWRENLEIAVVAVAVAMAFRTYFIQPFKIPTGSMQPTLYGIHYRPQDAPRIFDRYPLNLFKWAVYGEWYREYRAADSGIVNDAYIREDDPGKVHIVIGNRVHSLPKSLATEFRFRPGDFVRAGDLLTSGVRTMGDHIFVNRVRWNFFPPRRGEVMVFTTRNIPQIAQDTHYIKRMVGMPDETLGISPPFLLVNEERVMEPEMIRQISSRQKGYDGYKLTGAENGGHRFALNTEIDRLKLGPTEYAAFGDNTGNSLDSRYWGSVPRQNLVGPAFWVYWPYSSRWGRIH